MSTEPFACYLVEKDEDGTVRAGMTRRPLAALPEGEVLIRVQWSSLNFKDGLAATGQPGVAKKYPHVPGIDAAGTVAESSHADFQAGQSVIVTGYDLGAGQWGGWSEYIRVPAEWVIPLPDGLTLESAMHYGTAGFTAAMSVQAIVDHGIEPAGGKIVVTGATGGVGCIAVMLLAQLGYQVIAVTGKESMHAQLKEFGATDVVGRDEILDDSSRPLLSARWAGAVDCVGGDMLTSILRATDLRGCVTCCGLVAGPKLNMTVFPFILRGAVLVGIDSGWYPRDLRLKLWEKLGGAWRLDKLADFTETVPLADIEPSVQKILRGEVAGRTLVSVE
ncbi:putative acrylyl-CoA reductase AcuI [Symmachiella dynata]|uniref:Putative acrylyl-CoA reductase AcuI n=1 Tax=Symmachiella dynata TaxID=2527995 RepID=A0A517ZKZ2_9PLAN|nr:acryloyl-CoA reductase [Symmachiella dynata]QDT47570.1 putative acrylyl-CoA reductase AcuI [Symmachiella dynata]QDU43148.1 putative acrylyl-CoA reductase AcuI [Symmachiella dynata]